ncbi:hypothetical protein ACFLZ7_02705 [Nanoarchaeota archaeon]
MQLKKIGWTLILYIALVEGIALLIQDLITPFVRFSEPGRAIASGLIIGFFAMLLTVLIYNLIPYKIKINNKKINKVGILVPSVFNALFLALTFVVQLKIMDLESLGLIGFSLLGLISVGVALFLSIFVYNELNFKIRLDLNNKKQKINRIPFSFALIAGFFEFFIITLMVIFYFNQVPAFVNGFLSGLLGSLIPLAVLNELLEKINIKV